MEAWEKKSRTLRNENKLFRNIKKVFFFFIDFQGIFVKTEYHNPKKFQSKNRKDVDLVVEFLRDVIEYKISIENTKYFKKCCEFGDTPENHTLHLKHILELYNEIKNNGIKKPLIVAKYTSSTIKTWYWLNGKKVWKEFKNETGFQLIEGTHRLPIAIYLDLKNIPVKMYKPTFTEIVNFTDMFKIYD